MQIYPWSLTVNGVSIQSDEYGMRAYVNSTRGRTQLEVECPADIVKAVEEKWGNAPTVTEPTMPTQPTPQPSETDKQLAAMTLNQAQMAATITALQQSNAALMLKIAGGK